MGKAVFDISMSLDGYIAASNRRPEEPLGDGGERLHDWAMGGEDGTITVIDALPAAPYISATFLAL